MERIVMEQEDGRVAVGEQALVNQAATHLGPTGFDPSRYYVGQRLWFAASRRGNHNCYVMVAKVGRKWVSLTREDGGREFGRVQVGGRSVDGGGYTSPGKLYGSESEHAEEKAVDALWDLIRQLASSYQRPAHMNRTRIVQVLSILSDSDGSGEADETRGGSAVGDSADPRGIAQGTAA